MTDRRKLTTLDRLKIMVRQAVCPDCGEKLGALNNCEFDHLHQLAMGGADALDNLVAKHVDCHKAKTKLDAGRRAKVKRITGRKSERFAGPARGVEIGAEPEIMPRKRKTIQSRGFDKSRRKKMDGTVEVRT